MNSSSTSDLPSTPLSIALRLAPRGFLVDIRRTLSEAGVIRAVQNRKIAPVFDWAMQLLALQGISDRAAISYQRAHGLITWAGVWVGLESRDRCPRLRSWWHFQCGYRKGAQTCAEPTSFAGCHLPRHDLRKGTLNEAAFGFALFVRDVCGDDFVRWIDERLALVDAEPDRTQARQKFSDNILWPLTEIPGTGAKIWSMILADLLLGADPAREHWIAAGASMIVVDSLTHNFLHRTGTLQRHNADHAYGPRCYLKGGCVDVIEALAREVDARAYDPDLPSFCPRLVQHALWYFCAESGRNICNGRQIDDRYSCRQVFCPAGPECARLPGILQFDTELHAGKDVICCRRRHRLSSGNSRVKVHGRLSPDAATRRSCNRWRV